MSCSIGLNLISSFSITFELISLFLNELKVFELFSFELMLFSLVLISPFKFWLKFKSFIVLQLKWFVFKSILLLDKLIIFLLEFVFISDLFSIKLLLDFGESSFENESTEFFFEEEDATVVTISSSSSSESSESDNNIRFISSFPFVRELQDVKGKVSLYERHIDLILL